MLERALSRVAHPLEDDASLEPLIARIGDARIVMLGEATHGTSEFYTWRARITARLMRERGFRVVAVEGDWPDCLAVDRALRSAEDPRAALKAFTRWPTWMWANHEVAELVAMLRASPGARFYGLDVYSLWDSIRALVARLDELDPEAAQRAREAWACFEPYGEEADRYALASQSVPRSCQEHVVRALLATREAMLATSDPDERLDAEQNAEIMVNAEGYYRAMVEGGATTWNLRDTHMMDTLDRILARHGPAAKAVVWAHNTHVGDARATDMAAQGMTNLGQLARERHGRDHVVLVGFGTHRGSVIAARAWDAPMQRMRVPEAAPGSLEMRMHEVVGDDALFLPDDAPELREEVGHRAIGVVYHPERDRAQYVPTRVGQRYDAFLFLDRTTAVRPLHVTSDHIEMPETYPWGV